MPLLLLHHYVAVVRFQSLLGVSLLFTFCYFIKYLKPVIFIFFVSIPQSMTVYYFCLFPEIFVVDYFFIQYKPIVDRLNTIYRAIKPLFLLYLYNVYIVPISVAACPFIK